MTRSQDPHPRSPSCVRKSQRLLRAHVIVLCLVGCAAPRALDSQRPETQQARAAPPAPAQERSRTTPERGAHEGVAVGTRGAVASAEPHATGAALQVLQAGGNAADAAVTLAFALAVTHPSAGNLGGGGFMLLRTAQGQSVAIDYRETAPLSATRDMYLDAAGKLTQDSVLGPRAAGIPGTVAGLSHAHAQHGTRPWAELLAPAIRLAQEGHTLDAYHAQQLQRVSARMLEAGMSHSATYYRKPDGTPLQTGDLWRQPELARTLTLIAQQGARAFYHGQFAEELAHGVQKLGGLWTPEDLAGYRAIERTPIRFSYLGHEILTMPPPSSGGVVLRAILFASERFALRQQPWRSPEAMHVYLEAARRAYADRNAWLADPSFARVPTQGLLDPAYLATRMQSIDLRRATPSSQIAPGVPPTGSPETTHFSVIDEQGNAVSNTYTLNSGFGALVVVPGTGILLNNEMDDFSAQPGEANMYGLVQGEANKIEPGKRMLSSMTPTIITKDGELRAVLGTPGGPTITTTVAQLTRALLDYGVTLDEAVRAPRLHHQWLPDQVVVEARVEPALRAGLEALGHEVVETTWGNIGHADCIEVDPKTRGYRAVADVTRGSGGAAAY